jgi:hypothetical protein
MLDIDFAFKQVVPVSYIRIMIRQKNRIHRKAKHFNNLMHWNKFRKIRNEVTSLVRNTKA